MRRVALCAFAWLVPSHLLADSVLVAVASNFAPALATLTIEFERASGHKLRTAAGSTGKLYAQIVQGAPFDVFLAADQTRPRLLEASGHAVNGSRFTYANGRLALCSRDARASDESLVEVLRLTEFRHFAIANPNTAPYGVAALQALQALELDDVVERKLVRAENVGQALAFVASGSAEYGLVALSGVQVAALTGGFWEVPAALHEPISQDAVLLARARNNPAANEFLAYLQSTGARQTIVEIGYDLP